jgi:NADPH:quinone reductase-like Zn-dependent oxidoreductase
MPKRIVFRKYGSVSQLALEEYALGPLAEKSIRVQVEYAGVNYADVIARRGFYKMTPPLPACLGFEVAGTVAEVGSAVTDHTVGQRVLAMTRFGGYAEVVDVEADRAFHVPPDRSLIEAAALPAVSLTSWHALQNVMRVRAGESILIQAVAGGVGLAALQLAKHAGLVTYGTASSAEKLALARKYGLDHGIDYAQQDFEHEVLALTRGRGVDWVLDSLGGPGLRKGYRCVARGGMLVTIGAAEVVPSARNPLAMLKAGAALARAGWFQPLTLLDDNRAIAGIQGLGMWDDLARIRATLLDVIGLWEAGVLTPHIDRVIDFADVATAHTLLESRQTRGKLVLRTSFARSN